jgi:UDP-N-acetylmuramyl pentapeptide phosphotransferase/UDP-N-acetylglucosamine-1-phosphate transferase
VFQRHNYRDHSLPTAVGLLLPVVAATVVGVHVVLFDVWRSTMGASASGWGVLSTFGPVTVELAVAFAFLGLLDDLGGLGESGGFSGHLKALAEGRVTTGLIKMVGGPLLALTILAGASAQAGRIGYLRDAALVCLAANLANLFDRAPGRVNKVGQLAFVVLALATLNARLVPVAVVMGAAAALLGPDLRETFMLGDSGSNVIGVVLGFGAVVTTTESQRWIVLVVLLALNVASEFVSFTKVIESVAPLRAFDRLGSPHRPR